jgi:hypothetical protein
VLNIRKNGSLCQAKKATRYARYEGKFRQVLKITITDESKYKRRKQKCRLFMQKATGNWPKEKGISFQIFWDVGAKRNKKDIKLDMG